MCRPREKSFRINLDMADGPATAQRFADGTEYFGQLGRVSYDEAEVKVKCHLCGGWFRAFGGSHLRRTHGWTLAQYRVAFQLGTRTPTVAAGVSQVLAANTRRRVAAGELPAPPAPPVSAEQRRVMALRRISPDRSLAALRPVLVRELHPTRNGDLDPYTLGPSSLQKLWWRCPECEHEWQTSSQIRVGGGYGCPRCAAAPRAAARRRTVRPGRSLAAVRSALLGGARGRTASRRTESDVRSWAITRRCAPRARRRAARPRSQHAWARIRDRRPVALLGVRARMDLDRQKARGRAWLSALRPPARRGRPPPGSP